MPKTQLLHVNFLTSRAIDPMLQREMRLIEIPRKMASLGVFNEHFFQKFCTKWGKRGKNPTLGTFFTEIK